MSRYIIFFFYYWKEASKWPTNVSEFILKNSNQLYFIDINKELIWYIILMYRMYYINMELFWKFGKFGEQLKLMNHNSDGVYVIL